MDAGEKAAEKVVAAIYEGLNRIDVQPEVIADRLSRLPGQIQYRLWRIVKFLIRQWATDARYEQYDSQYKEVYLWAERKDD